jgi:hypothetical protein
MGFMIWILAFLLATAATDGSKKPRVDCRNASTQLELNQCAGDALARERHRGERVEKMAGFSRRKLLDASDFSESWEHYLHCDGRWFPTKGARCMYGVPSYIPTHDYGEKVPA